MKKHLEYFVHGAILVAPIAITTYVVWIVVTWLDGGVSNLLETFMGPGLSWIVHLSARIACVLMVFVVIYLTGVLANVWLFRAAAGSMEKLVERIPILKTLYTAVRDMMKFFVGGREGGAGKPVTYSLPGTDLKMLGLITNASPPPEFNSEKEELAFVYFPLSYQMGGLTMLVRTDRLKPVDLEAATMMRLVVTGGVSGREPSPEGPEQAPAA